MTFDEELVDRVRSALSAREVEWGEEQMFGSLVFLVGDAIVLGARDGGGLLVRCDPAEAETLLSEVGPWYAQPARMGKRQMSDSWLDVSPDAVEDDDGLARWVATALRWGRG